MVLFACDLQDFDSVPLDTVNKNIKNTAVWMRLRAIVQMRKQKSFIYLFYEIEFELSNRIELKCLTNVAYEKKSDLGNARSSFRYLCHAKLWSKSINKPSEG